MKILDNRRKIDALSIARRATVGDPLKVANIVSPSIVHRVRFTEIGGTLRTRDWFRLALCAASWPTVLIAQEARDTLRRVRPRPDDPVVTGPATTTDHLRATTAVALVRSRQLSAEPSASLEGALQGKILGATITLNSGASTWPERAAAFS